MFKRNLVAYGLTGVLALTLVACGGSQQSQQSQQSAESTSAIDSTAAEKTEEKKDERKVLGEQSEGAIEVALKNGLDAKITALSIRESTANDYSANLLKEGATIEKGEEVRLFVAKSANEGATYNLLATAEGVDGNLEFFEVPLSGAAKATLMEADGIAYVDLEDAKGAKTSTKDAASQKKAEEEALAAEATVAAEATATYEETSYDNGVTYEEYSYEEPVYEDYSAPVETTAAPEQSGDACAGDVLLRF